VEVQSWMIKSWPTVQWYLPLEADRFPAFKHLCTQVRESTLPGGKRQGETVWMGVLDGEPAGLAWEWAEERPGVVLLADPNSILSNIRFVGHQQAVQSPLAVVVALNRIAHQLPWQEAVCRVLQGLPQERAVVPMRVVVHPARQRQAAALAMAERAAA
jgi:hypothetical protein